MPPVKSPPTFEAGSRDAGWRDLRLAALCVGVGAYAEAADRLGNTVSDAEAVYQAINACAGCRAAIIRDPADKKTIRKHLRHDFLDALAASPPDVVFVFLAGHGVQAGTHVYLIPAKAASADETDLKEDCLSHLTVFEWLHQFLDAPAKDLYKRVKFVVILDVCRVAGASDGECAGPISLDPEQVKEPRSWSLCYSTARGSVAADGDLGSHSPLALGLLDGQTGIFARGVSLKQGIENACAAVRERTRQSPIANALDALGDFMLQESLRRERASDGDAPDESKRWKLGARRVFLGYRVDADADLVERLYYQLKAAGVDVWWDKECLPGGQPWEQSFLDALSSSDVFVPVLSKAALAKFALLTPESACDNVLLEHRMALELKERGDLRLIFPVFVGERDTHAQLGEIYGDFFQGWRPAHLSGGGGGGCGTPRGRISRASGHRRPAAATGEALCQGCAQRNH